jgi:hypothetical protein
LEVEHPHAPAALRRAAPPPRFLAPFSSLGLTFTFAA